MLMRSPTRWARPKLVRPPGFILPCQPVLATKAPVGDGWLHELKHDGFRIIAHKDGERVHLWSRNGRDRSGDFVAMADAVRALPASRIVLDGEAVAHCLDGLPGFRRLLSGDGQASRPPEFFLRIVTPSGLEFGWPVSKGSIGYKVAEEIVALAEPAPKGSKRAKAAGGGGDGVQA